MGENGLFIVHLHHDNKPIGDVAIEPLGKRLPFKPGDDVRISSFSAASDRCFPLVILHAITNEGVLFKMESVDSSNVPGESTELGTVHLSCLRELKTAVIQLPGGLELHLAAMISNRRQKPCFWGFAMLPGLYSSCLTMLNLRCLALVFDLDETLIVANTLRSFEDRIDALGSKLKTEPDAQKASVIEAELKRYIHDRALLRQYADEDRVWDNTAKKFANAQDEVVPLGSEGGVPLKRPVVRLQDRNMVFTRINPKIRDTSVLVRLRPAWEELRSYLTAKGRKRFEVFVCTMSEKEYALEMWRLLDPESQLLSAKEMADRVVCVKPGSKKSLLNMFANGYCHPKMAMVIDDRLKVWEERDQPQVHVVPAFAPYYAPQAETNSLVPVLCVARNVACNVRGGFFRDLDEIVARKLAEVDYDVEVSTLPQPPLVSNYMIVEDDNGMAVEVVNGTKEFPDGMADSETEKILTEAIGSSTVPLPSISLDNEARQSAMQQLVLPVTHPLLIQKQLSAVSETQCQDKEEVGLAEHELSGSKAFETPALNLFEPSLQSSPVREEGEVPESELDPDTRRRLLILQHGQDTEHAHPSQEKSIEPSSFLRPSLHATLPTAPAGGWLGVEEEISPMIVSKPSSGLLLETESSSFSKQHTLSPSFYGSEVSSIDLNSKVYAGDGKRRFDPIFVGRTFSESDVASIHSSSTSHDMLTKPVSGVNSSNPVHVLRDIAQKCNMKLEFRSIINTTKELLFSVEVLFDGEKVGEGIGRTSKEAQQKAADSSLRYMASQFLAQPMNAVNVLVQAQILGPSHEPLPRWNSRDPRFQAGLGPSMLNEDASIPNINGQLKNLDFQSLQAEPNRAITSVAALRGFVSSVLLDLLFLFFFQDILLFLMLLHEFSVQWRASMLSFKMHHHQMLNHRFLFVRLK
ncbi:hypothetical protein KP509_03G049400 [Ceratopteris richardii]|uniref:protein-serine/threonine phosphatase n=1 Tax=Ceratopteris richardii TaxID=49495 RepID=A0A8T2V7J1_CERRI|nr:hypothetical protein KP509_03G049400 [Ceratopteris richardii]